MSAFGPGSGQVVCVWQLELANRFPQGDIRLPQNQLGFVLSAGLAARTEGGKDGPVKEADALAVQLRLVFAAQAEQSLDTCHVHVPE